MDTWLLHSQSRLKLGWEVIAPVAQGGEGCNDLCCPLRVIRDETSHHGAIPVSANEGDICYSGRAVRDFGKERSLITKMFSIGSPKSKLRSDSLAEPLETASALGRPKRNIQRR